MHSTHAYLDIRDVQTGNENVMHPDRLSLTARIGLISLLMAAPLAFGAVQAWAWGGMAIVVVCLFLLWAIATVRSCRLTLIWTWLYVPAFAAFALICMQLLLGWTVDRIGTREALLKFAMYLLIFFLAQQLFVAATGSFWTMLGAVITVYSFFVAVFATIQFFASPGLLYGSLKPHWGGYVFGPYVSHNNYAGLMEMLIPISIGFIIGLRASHPAKPLLLFAVLISIVSVFLSGSRGGGIALAVEFVLISILLATTAATRAVRARLLMAGLTIAMLTGIFFSWLDPGDLRKRWEVMANAPEMASGQRHNMARDALRMSRDHLLTGVGMGAFEVSYPKYQSFANDWVVDFAHNDYAQFFAEAGLSGWIAAPASIVLFLASSFGQLRSRTTQPDGWIRLGAAVGVCGILVHSLSDFNLHIPANAAWFAIATSLATLPNGEPLHECRRALCCPVVRS